MLLLADQYPLFLLPSQRIPVLGSFVVVIVLWVLFVFICFGYNEVPVSEKLVSFENR